MIWSAARWTWTTAAVQQLRLEVAREYDPDAVEALSRVIIRRSMIQL